MTAESRTCLSENMRRKSNPNERRRAFAQLPQHVESLPGRSRSTVGAAAVASAVAVGRLARPRHRSGRGLHAEDVPRSVLLNVLPSHEVSLPSLKHAS